MPVRVYIPTRIRVDVDALLDRQADIEEALAAAAGRALANSRYLVLAKRGGYVAARAHPPEISWTGDGLAKVPASRRNEIEECVTEVLARLVERTDICDWAQSWGRVTDPLFDRPAESFDEEGYDPYTNAYTIPSYDDPKRKAKIPVVDPPERDPFARPTPAQLKAWAAQKKAPAPLDYDALARRLEGTDVSDRGIAGLEMWDAVAAGDPQAFHLALLSLRADNAAPTEILLSALRQLAKDNPQKFKELLLAELAGRPSELLLKIERTDNSLRFPVSSANVQKRSKEIRQSLQAIAGVVRVARDIPSAAWLLKELERRTPGLRRLFSLVDALIEVRLKLQTYLRNEQRETVDDMFRQGFAGVPPPRPRESTDPSTLADIEKNTLDLSRASGQFAALAGEELIHGLIYDMQEDLVKNYSWISATLEQIQQIDGLILSYRDYYKESADNQEEVKALLEARKLYLKNVVDNWLPTVALATTLMQKADLFYENWFVRAADRKVEKLMKALSKLNEAVDNLTNSGGASGSFVRDSYNDSYDSTIRLRGSAEQELLLIKNRPGRDIKYLATATRVEQNLAILSVRVSLLLLWFGAHQIGKLVLKNPSDDVDDQVKWLNKIDNTRGNIEQEYQKPDLSNLQSNLDLWRMELESVQLDIKIAVDRKIAIHFLIMVVAVVVTAGVALVLLPEGISLAVSLLVEVPYHAGRNSGAGE